MGRTSVFILLLVTGCGEREPGPHSYEEEKVTYWEVMSSAGRASQCTDSADWSDVVGGPVFNNGSFLMYRVEAGGQTATGQSCDTLSSSSCTDTELIWQVDENILSHEAEPVPLDSAGDCVINLLADWTVVDEGESALFQVQIQFEYATDDVSCTAIEAALIEESPNGFGLADCTVTMDADMGFASVN